MHLIFPIASRSGVEWSFILQTDIRILPFSLPLIFLTTLWLIVLGYTTFVFLRKPRSELEEKYYNVYSRIHTFMMNLTWITYWGAALYRFIFTYNAEQCCYIMPNIDVIIIVVGLAGIIMQKGFVLKGLSLITGLVIITEIAVLYFFEEYFWENNFYYLIDY